MWCQSHGELSTRAPNGSRHTTNGQLPNPATERMNDPISTLADTVSS
ncbi:hypothetical protein GS506_26955 [Rhodococcus hoagii]|nr:hypothetical protein [Prescottella equi]